MKKLICLLGLVVCMASSKPSMAAPTFDNAVGTAAHVALVVITVQAIYETTHEVCGYVQKANQYARKIKCFQDAQDYSLDRAHQLINKLIKK